LSPGACSAGAVGPEAADELTLTDLEADAVDGADLA
jgi:hypothetical protein